MGYIKKFSEFINESRVSVNYMKIWNALKSNPNIGKYFQDRPDADYESVRIYSDYAFEFKDILHLATAYKIAVSIADDICIEFYLKDYDDESLNPGDDTFIGIVYDYERDVWEWRLNTNDGEIDPDDIDLPLREMIIVITPVINPGTKYTDDYFGNND